LKINHQLVPISNPKNRNPISRSYAVKSDDDPKPNQYPAYALKSDDGKNRHTETRTNNFFLERQVLNLVDSLRTI
jgi:hypothetical protein